MENKEEQPIDLTDLLEGVFQLSNQIRAGNKNKPELIKKVEAWGGSAHISISKKHLGKIATINFIEEEKIESVEEMLRGFQKQDKKTKEDTRRKNK